jgi:hypothetical protein
MVQSDILITFASYEENLEKNVEIQESEHFSKNHYKTDTFSQESLDNRQCRSQGPREYHLSL